MRRDWLADWKTPSDSRLADLVDPVFRFARGAERHGWQVSAPPAPQGRHTAPMICPKDRCRAVIGDALTYRDRDHLTGTFARTLAPWMGGQLPRLG